MKKLYKGFISVKDISAKPVEQQDIFYNDYKFNRSKDIDKLPKKIDWIDHTKAILIVHGIGNQLPFDTLDSFARGIIEQYNNARPGIRLSLSHELVPKARHNGEDIWFDNVVRIRKENDERNFIDIYEYYWANYTEDKASWDDINNWLSTVVKGGKRFYKENEMLSSNFEGTGPFTDRKGNFKFWKYKLFLQVIGKSLIVLNKFIEFLLKLLNRIPLAGEIAQPLLKGLIDTGINKFNNIVGDIVVYNVVDPKSKFYSIRTEILDGAVNALRFLLERGHDADASKPYYDSVVVAGHSLGSQIAYDAINRINLLVNQNQLRNYEVIIQNGERRVIQKGSKKEISEYLDGFITFGSPLDKIAFFLREQVPPESYVRRQIVKNYHCFKQLNWYELIGNSRTYPKLQNKIGRFLDDIQWRNYHDRFDYVSGSLDYYKNVENVNCKFEGSNPLRFTHSWYWESAEFYNDIVCSYCKSKGVSIINQSKTL